MGESTYTPPNPWTKSSFSGGGGCVEIQHVPGGVLMRNSRDPNGHVMQFNHREWDAFCKGVKANEFEVTP